MQHARIAEIYEAQRGLGEPIPVTEAADARDGAFFSKRYRNRRHVREYRRQYEPGGTCRKKSPWNSTMTPGLLILSCEHKIIRGFYFLKSHESPAHAAQVFLDRFKESDMEGLRIIYDNGCHLHRWCLAREAPFFAKSQFFIDRLHWCGHIACQPTYNLDTYIYSHDIKSINSQAVEQINNTLAPLRKPVAGMSVGHAVEHLKEFCWRS